MRMYFCSRRIFAESGGLLRKKLSDLKMRPDFSSRIPPLLMEELEQLEENILAEGCVINPIVVWGDVIVDGHNRYRILLKHPEIDYSIFEKTFSDDEYVYYLYCGICVCPKTPNCIY